MFPCGYPIIISNSASECSLLPLSCLTLSSRLFFFFIYFYPHFLITSVTEAWKKCLIPLSFLPSSFPTIHPSIYPSHFSLSSLMSSGFRCGMGAACPSRTMLTQWPQQTNPSHADPKWRFLPIFQSTEKLPWGFLCNPMEEKGVAPQNDWLNFLPVWQVRNSKVCLILFKENKLIWHCRLTWL